jgi:hypothetical protein
MTQKGVVLSYFATKPEVTSSGYFTRILVVSSVFVQISNHFRHDRATDAGWGSVTDPHSRGKCVNNEATDH